MLYGNMETNGDGNRQPAPSTIQENHTHKKQRAIFKALERERKKVNSARAKGILCKSGLLPVCFRQ